MNNSRKPSARNMTTMLCSFDVVAGVGEERHRWRQYLERHTISRGPLHPAPSENNRHVMRSCRRHRIAIRASAIRLPRVEIMPTSIALMMGTAAPK
jgi:hypothetical protein